MSIFIPRDKQHLIELILSINDTANISIDSDMLLELGFIADDIKGCLIGVIGEEHIKLYFVHSVIFRKDFYYIENNERIEHRNNDLPSTLVYSYVDGTLVSSKWFNHGLNFRLNKGIDYPIEIFFHSDIYTSYYFHTFPSNKPCLMLYGKNKDEICNVTYEIDKKQVDLETIQGLFPRFMGIKKPDLYHLTDLLTLDEMSIIEMYLM